jgi:hypothetical protein
MSQDNGFIVDALLKSIKFSMEDGEGVIVTVKEKKVVVANIGGEASIIPLSDIIDNSDQFEDGQWININTSDDE